MLTDAVIAALPKIEAMGREEIAKTHAAGHSALISDGRGELTCLHTDGSRNGYTKVGDDGITVTTT